MRMRLILVAVMALGFLASGCGAPPGTPLPALEASSPAAVAEVPLPVSVEIPDLDVRSTLIDLHLDAADHLEAPPVTEPMQAGWYADGVRPGAVGPAVIAAHVSGRPADSDHSVPGLFAHLAGLKAGALVHVIRADGSDVTFAVDRVETEDKTEFPTADVYSDTDNEQLRLITCGGRFDPAKRRYLDNVIVWLTRR